MSYNLTVGIGILFTVLSITAGTFFLHQRKAGNHKRSFWLKGTGSLFFVLTGVVFALYNKENITGAVTVAGIFCGLLGDQLLAMRKILPEHKKPFFYAGGLAFSAGHVFYIAALWKSEDSLTKFTAVCFLLLLTGAIGYAERKDAVSPGRLIPQTLYISFVAAVSAMAASAFWYHQNIYNLLFALGGLSFFISDNLLGAYTFGKDKSAKLNILLHITYYGAQILIAWSILFLQ